MAETQTASPRPSLKIIETDPNLAPFESDLRLRMQLYRDACRRLAGDGSLSDFANGSLYYGFQLGRNG